MFMVNLIKNFWYKNRYKFFAVFSIAIFITAFLLLKPYNIDESDVDIFIPEIEKNTESIKIKEDIYNFLQYKNQKDPIVRNENQVKNTNSSSQKLDNDYLIDLYQKIDVLNTEISQLKEEISNIRKNTLKTLPSKSSNELSIILIELYRIKNAALLGQNFNEETTSLLAIAQNYPSIQKDLIIIKNIAQLPKKQLMENKLAKIEESLIKNQAKQDLAADKNFVNRMKLSLLDYIKIKKTDNLNDADPFLKLKQIRNFITQENYKDSYIISQSLSNLYHDFSILTNELKKHYDFHQSFNNIFKIILENNVQN